MTNVISYYMPMENMHVESVMDLRYGAGYVFYCKVNVSTEK